MWSREGNGYEYSVTQHTIKYTNHVIRGWAGGTSSQERWYQSDWRYTAQGLVLCQIISYRQTGGSLAPARRDAHNKQDCPESISNIGGPWRHATMIIYQQSMTADRKQRSATKRLPITCVMCSIDLTHNFPNSFVHRLYELCYICHCFEASKKMANIATTPVISINDQEKSSNFV